jgi:hypothetical protein
MNQIGGFFELELPKGRNLLHKKALSFSTGRACFNFILNFIKPKKIYIPYYLCDVVIDPIIINNIQFEYYSINDNLEPPNIKLFEDEYLLYVNYFGIKNDVIQRLLKRYGNRLIVDNSQGFFENQYDSIWSFNSARKFFGIPDGAYLYSPFSVEYDFPRNTFIKYDHLIQRIVGNLDVAFKQFHENEKVLNSDLLNMSLFSEKILNSIDYKQVAEKRIENFYILHDKLKDINQFKIHKGFKGIPLCYPFLPKETIDKSIFHEKGLFIPTFWERFKYTVNNAFDFEKEFSDRLLPLPIDQRYSRGVITNVVKYIR